jgi:hypothetical protein
MEATTSHLDAAPINRYGLPLMWRLYAFIFPALGLGVSFFLLQLVFTSSQPTGGGTKAVAIVGSAIILAISFAVFVAVMRIRLEVSPEGIVYYGIGYRVRTTWGNITGMGDVWTGRQSSKGLLLNEPGLEMSRWLGSGVKALPFLNVINGLTGHGTNTTGDINAYGKIIPVGSLLRHWEEGKLGETIRRYAPQAFARDTDTRT